MKKKEWNEGLNHLDPDLVEKYVEQKDRLRQKNKKPKGIWLRFGAIAACFLLIAGAVIVVPRMRGDSPEIIPPRDNGDRYKDLTIQSGEYGIVWPWKYKTIYEKYYSIDVGGTEFIGQQRELSASYVGEKLGSYKATGYDDTSDGVYHEHFDAYEIKDVASDRLIAVKMENHYYIFISKNYVLYYICTWFVVFWFYIVV